MVHETDPRRKARRDLIVRIVTIVFLAALVLVALAPSLTPSSYLAGQIKHALETSLSRPVTVGRCRLGWLSGLEVESLQIDAGPARPGQPLVVIQNLQLQYAPWEMMQSLTSRPAHLGRAAIGNLNFFLFRDAQGHFDLPVSAEPPPEFKSIKVAAGDIHFDDQMTQTQRLVTHVRLALGRLEGSDRVYLTAGGQLWLPGRPDEVAGSGMVSLNGLLDRFDLNNLAAATGGCDVEWDNVELGYLLPVPRAGGRALAIDARTGGQVSLRLTEAETVTLEGTVTAPEVALGPVDQPQVRIERPTLSFVGEYQKSTGRLTIKPVQVSGAGSSLRADGGLERRADGSLHGELKLNGTLGWTPLKKQIVGLGQALTPFTSATGTARLENFDVKVDNEWLEAQGRIDLSRSELVWRPFLAKEADQRARFDLDLRANLITGDLDLRQARLRIGTSPEAAADSPEAADLDILARTVTADEAAGLLKTWRGPTAATPPGNSPRRMLVQVRVPEVRILPRHIPATQETVERFRLAGFLAADALFDPGAAPRPFAVHVDATRLAFETAKYVGKRADSPCVIDLEGDLRGHDDLPECRYARLVLGAGDLTWTGVLKGARGPDGRPARLDFDGRLAVREIQEWMRLARPNFPAHPFLGLLGNLACDLRGHLDEDEFALDSADFDAALASIELSTAAGRVEESSRLFAKPLGQVAKGNLNGFYRRGRDELHLKAAGLLAGSAITFEADAAGLKKALQSDGAVDLPDRLRAAGRIQSEDISGLLAAVPAAQQVLAPYQPQGALVWDFTCAIDDRVRLTTRIDATKLAYAIPDRAAKKRGLDQVLTLDVALPRQFAHGAAEFALNELSLTAGPSRIGCKGAVRFDVDTLKKGSSPDVLLRAANSAELEGRVDLVQDVALLDACPWWRDVSQAYQIEGRAAATLTFSGSHTGGSLALTVDGTGAGFQYGEETRKPVGTPARMAAVFKTTPMAGELNVEVPAFDIADLHLAGAGTLYGRNWLLVTSGNDVDFAVRVTGKADQLARLVRLVPYRRLRALDLQGGVEFGLELARDRYGVELRSAEMKFKKARMTYNGDIVALDGDLSLSRRRLRADALDLRVADSAAVLVADIATPFEKPTGEFSLTGTQLDLDRFWKVLGVEPKEPAPVQVGIPPDWPRLSRVLGLMDVRGHVAFDRLVCTDATGLHYDWRAFVTNMELARGQFAVPEFKAVMLGGVVIGRASTDLTAANPEVRLAYVTRNLEASADLTAMVRRFFPDMTINGKANQTYETRSRLFPTQDAPNYPVGFSEFTATDGTIQGPGAPQWLSDLLPGLKLTTYRFNRMFSRSEMKPDGRNESLMLFDGQPYAIAISGYTAADGQASYTLDVDFLNSINLSEKARALQQGRVPLMVYSGRIANSKWVKLNINYKLPHEVAWEIFLKRSLVYGLLHSPGEPAKPTFEPYQFAAPPTGLPGPVAPPK